MNWLSIVCWKIGYFLVGVGFKLWRKPSVLKMSAKEYREYMQKLHPDVYIGRRITKPVGDPVQPGHLRYPDTVQGRLAQHDAVRYQERLRRLVMTS